MLHQVARVRGEDVDPTSFTAAYNRRSPTDRPPPDLSWINRLRMRRTSRLSPAERRYAESVIDQFKLRWLVPEATV